MQQSAPNRKRPAPGASPAISQPQAQSSQPNFAQMPDNTDFGSYNFANPFSPDPNFTDAAFVDALSAQQPLGFPTNPIAGPSTDLVRRAGNQQVGQPGGQQESWVGLNTIGGQTPEEDEEDLDMKVALAKRDAQGKRKQIPPFVQKLSSFLDSGNTDLIRWSDDGRSFIVLDEDEFARTLIPELFKHSNYASFVRQLNMYGFHKTVNITDGSLRQSEKARKGVKPPSMYSHPYFRKNRPDLLWLIQKPAGKSNAKRKREGADSDEDSPGPDGKHHGEVGAAGGSDLTPIARNEMVAFRQELKKLQQQQELISRMINHLKSQNEQFIRQATAFQALHDRHENSINAILTFLATFYNRSLEGHAGQNLVNMFSNPAQNHQTQGSVVEEFNDVSPNTSNQVQRYVKRPQLLLGGPQSAAPGTSPGVISDFSTRPSTTPPVNNSTGQNRYSSRASVPPNGSSNSASRKSDSPAIKNDAPTPDVLHQVPESDQMMSLINSVNATNAAETSAGTPNLDFSSALDHYQNANGNSPLTPQQRDDMLALIANQHGGDGLSNSNNALVSPNPPAMPDLSRFKENQQQLEMLANLQKQQEAKVHDLQRRIQPLSPSGSIPGVGDSSNPFDSSSGDYDPNAFLNFDNWSPGNVANDNPDLVFNPFSTDATAADFNWDDFDDPSAADTMFQASTSTPIPGDKSVGAQGVGKIESIGSEAASPSGYGAGDSEAGKQQDGGSASKRARKS